MQDDLFDLTLILSDDIPKSKSKEMGQWIVEKFAPIVQAAKFSKFHTLLPYSDSSSLLNGLYQTIVSETSESNEIEIAPAETGNARPWEWIKHGVVNQVNIIEDGNWNHSQTLSQLNDTSISLAVLGARRVRPRRQTFDCLFENGWRPFSSVTDSNSMFLDEPEPFGLSDEILESLVDREEINLGFNELERNHSTGNKKRSAETLLGGQMKRKG